MNFDYVLEGTPCGVVVNKGLQIYDCKIQKKFPEDIDLVTMGAESYLGIPICNIQGKTIGHIAGLHVQPLTRSYEEQAAILKIFAARSAAEIERQLAERELKQQNLRLEATLNQLKQTQMQLIHAEKMSSLGNMVAGIAHEINNPISFIHGNLAHARQYFDELLELLQLYQQEHTQPSQAIQDKMAAIDLDFLKTDIYQLFQSMRQGSQRIGDIVKSYRTFSRLDESTFKFVDIHESLESVLVIVQGRLQAESLASKITIHKTYGNLPRIYCSPAQLNQVFLNLLNNAIDALEELDQQQCSNLETDSVNHHSRDIWIQTSLISEHQIQVSISDNGSGIPEDVRAKIFDPFFTTKLIGKGTGLGLAVSYQIITDMHHGVIEVSSCPGQSTTFIIKLPIAP